MDKLGEPEFLHFLSNYDIICQSECLVSSNSDLNLGFSSENFTIMSFPRSKGQGGGLVLIYKSKLSSYICIKKYCCDSILWLKVSSISTFWSLFMFCVYSS